MRKAVIDVGSNAVLLLVEEKTSDGWRSVFESSEVTGLGTDTKVTGLIQPDAQVRTLAAIKRGYQKACELGADCRAAGTSALRIATNAQEFKTAAEAQGTPVEVVSGDEEAQLGLEAVMNDPTFAEHDRISVIDTGGHSTELTTAQRTATGWTESYRRSVPIGALGLLEGKMAQESPDSAARLATAREIDDAIALQYLPGQAGIAVALGATPTNLVTIREKMQNWDAAKVHGQYLGYEEVSKAFAWMCDMTLAERSKIVGLEKGREKTIHIGALILERFLQSLHVPGCFVSTRGWRHALLERD